LRYLFSPFSYYAIDAMPFIDIALHYFHIFIIDVATLLFVLRRFTLSFARAPAPVAAILRFH